MSKHSELCPVCRGEGVIKTPLREAITTADLQKTCHGCKGLGYIIVDDGDDMGNPCPNPINPPNLPSFPNPFYPIYPEKYSWTPRPWYQPDVWCVMTQYTGK